MAGGFGGYFDSAFLNISPDEESADEAASNSPQEPKAKVSAWNRGASKWRIPSFFTKIFLFMSFLKLIRNIVHLVT